MEHKTQTNHRITVKNVKELHGFPEGPAWTASLYFDGARVGTAEYGGWGGPVDFNLKQPEMRAEMEAYAATLPGWTLKGDDEPTPYNLEVLVGEAVDDWREEKYLKRAVKTRIVARHVGQPAGHYHEWKMKWQPAHAARLREQIAAQLERDGLKLAEILNERFATGAAQ